MFYSQKSNCFDCPQLNINFLDENQIVNYTVSKKDNSDEYQRTNTDRKKRPLRTEGQVPWPSRRGNRVIARGASKWMISPRLLDPHCSHAQGAAGIGVERKRRAKNRRKNARQAGQWLTVVKRSRARIHPRGGRPVWSHRWLAWLAKAGSFWRAGARGAVGGESRGDAHTAAANLSASFYHLRRKGYLRWCGPESRRRWRHSCHDFPGQNGCGCRQSCACSPLVGSSGWRKACRSSRCPSREYGVVAARDGWIDWLSRPSYPVDGVVDGAEFTCVADGPHGVVPVRSRSRREYRSPHCTSVVGRRDSNVDTPACRPTGERRSNCEDMRRGVVKQV